MTEFFSFIYNKRIYIKFAAAGLVAILTEMFVIAVSTEYFHLYYVVSAGIAFATGYFVSFCSHKFWTFRHYSREKIIREILIFLAVAVVGSLINVRCVYLLVEKFRETHTFKYDYIFIQAMMGMAIGVVNFLFYRFVIFRKKVIKKLSRRRRIVIATGIYPPDIGGPATYSQKLFEVLDQKGFDVKIVTYADKVETDNKNIVKISRQQNILWRYWKYFFAVLDRSSWADLVYVQGPVSEGFPSWLACRFEIRPFILKIVGDYAWEQGCQRFGVKDLLDDFQIKKYGWRVELMRKIQRRVAKAAVKIVVPSMYLKNIVKQWGIKEEKIEVIYNSVPQIEMALRKSEARSQLGLSGDLILSVGRLVPWKGFDTLIDLMNELLVVNPNFKLLIIGEGPEENKLKVQSKKLKVENSVKFLGKLNHDEVLKYMRAADMFVLNTGYEGLAHVLIEAMQVGLPVIATRVGGNPEVVDDGQTGIIVEYNNREQLKTAIIKLWHNRALANDLSEKAQSQIKNKFSQDVMIERVTKLLS